MVLAGGAGGGSTWVNTTCAPPPVSVQVAVSAPIVSCTRPPCWLYEPEMTRESVGSPGNVTVPVTVNELSAANVQVPVVTAATPPSVNPTRSQVPTSGMVGPVLSVPQAALATAAMNARALSGVIEARGRPRATRRSPRL